MAGRVAHWLDGLGGLAGVARVARNVRLAGLVGLDVLAGLAVLLVCWLWDAVLMSWPGLLGALHVLLPTVHWWSKAEP